MQKSFCTDVDRQSYIMYETHMTHPASHKDIINKFGPRRRQDMDRAMGLVLGTVQSWYWRNSIPAARWASLCQLADDWAVLGVTFETLAKAVVRKRAA